MNPAQAAAFAHPDVDLSDPIVVVITWLLTWGASKLVKGQGEMDKFRHALPALAVLIALAVRVALDTAQGQTASVETLLRALAAAGVAVLGHSQLRGAQKALRGDPDKTDSGVQS